MPLLCATAAAWGALPCLQRSLLNHQRTPPQDLRSQQDAHTALVPPLPQDLTKDVFRIDAIPSQSLDTVREWLSSMDVKFYENKVNLNWKQVLKSIVEVREGLTYTSCTVLLPGQQPQDRNTSVTHLLCV